MITIKQVSEMAGVSSATVSRVINNSGKVKEKNRLQVLKAMETLGYRHNVIAASLASNKTNTVGYVVPELHGSFYGEMMSGSEEVLRAANKNLFVVTGHSDEEAEKAEIETLLSRRCDALILHVEAVTDDYLIKLVQQNVPLIVVNRYVPAISQHCISLDNQHGGYLGTRYLVERGHRHIAYISGSLFKADSMDRLTGHKRALQEGGITFNPKLAYEGNFSAESGEHGVRELLKQGIEFTAISCGNDEMAAGAINALKAAGKQVPDDVSIVGFDDINYANYLTPKLTTVEYPMHKIGTMAARWVLDHAYGAKSLKLDNLLMPRLIERESCLPLA